MDLLQRRLPRVFEALQSALEYLGAVANLVFGDTPPPSPDQDAGSSTLPRAGDLTENREEVEVPSKSSPDITDSDLEKDSFSCIEVSTNTLDLSVQWSRVTLRRVSSLKRRSSGGLQHGSVSDASGEEASPCLLSQRRGLGRSQPGAMNEVCLEDSLQHPSSNSQISDGAQPRSIHKTCIEDLTLAVGTQRRSAERQQPAGAGDGSLEDNSLPGASKGFSMSTFYYPITERTSGWSPLSQGNENEKKDEGKEEAEEKEALNLTGILLNEIEEYLRAPMVPSWGVKESSFNEHEGANSMGEEDDRLQGYKREEQPTCEKDQMEEEKPTRRATPLGQEEWREERLVDEENEGREYQGTPTVAEQEEDREKNSKERAKSVANENKEYLWRSNATLRMKDKEEERKVSSKSEEEHENTVEDLQRRTTVTWKEGGREEESVGEEKREKVPDEKAAETEQEEVMVVEGEEEISRNRKSLESEEEPQDRSTFTRLQRGIKEYKTGRLLNEEMEETEKTQWKLTVRLFEQATERTFVVNKEEKSHASSTLTHQDDLTSERCMEEEDEKREEFQQKVTVILQDQIRKERFMENMEEEGNVGSTLTLQNEVRSERLMLVEKGVDECDSWVITTLDSDGRVVAREAGPLGGKNEEEEPPQISNSAMREQNMEGKAMDRLEQKTDEKEHSQRGSVTLEQGSVERDREEINVDEEVRMRGLIVDHSRAFVTKQEPLTMTERKEKPMANHFPEQVNEDHFERRIIVQKQQGDIHYDGDDAASQGEPDNLQEVEILLKNKEDIGAWVSNSWVTIDGFENVQGSLDDEMKLTHKRGADPQHEGKEELYPGEQDDHQELDNITHHGPCYQQEEKLEELVGGNKETSQKELGIQQVQEVDEEGALFLKNLCDLQLSEREEEETTIHQKQSGDLQVKEEEKMSKKEHTDIHLKEGVVEAFQMEQTEVPKEQRTPEWVPGDKQKEETYISQFQMEHGDLDRKKGEDKEKTSMMENGDLQEEGEENEELVRTQGDMRDNLKAREMEEAKGTHREHSDQHMKKRTVQRDQVDLHKEQESGKDEASKIGNGDLQVVESGKKEGTCQEEKVDQFDKEDRMSHKKSVTEKWSVEEETHVKEQVLEEERIEGDISLEKPKSEKEGREGRETSLGQPVSLEKGLEGDASLGTPVSEEDTCVQWELFLRETISEKGIFEGETYVGAPQSDKEEIEVGNKLLMEHVSEKLGGEEEDTCLAEPRSETERVEGEICLREFALKEVKLGEESSHSDGREDEKNFPEQLATRWSTDGEISLRELVPEHESVEQWISLEEPVIDKWVEDKEIYFGETVFEEVVIEEAASLMESTSEAERKIEGELSLGEPISKAIRDDPDATCGESLLEIDGSEGGGPPLGEVASEDEGGMVRKTLLGEFILENVGGMEELYLREPVSKEVQENPEASLVELILEKKEIDEGAAFQRDAVSVEEGLEGESSGRESVSEEEKGRVEEEPFIRESVSTARKKREEPLQESEYETKRREEGKTFLGEPLSGEERLVTNIFLGEPGYKREAFLGEHESDEEEEGDTYWEQPISEREIVKGELYSGESVSEKERVEVKPSHGGSVSGEDRRDEKETFLGEPQSDGKMVEETFQRETLLEDGREEREIYLGEEVNIKKGTYLHKPVSQDLRVKTEMFLLMQELEGGIANVELFQAELVLEDGRVKEEIYTREPVSEERQEEKKASQGERSQGEVAKEEVTIAGDAVQRDPVCKDWRGETETSLKKEVLEEGRVDGEVYQVKPVTEAEKGKGETYVREPISDDRREEEEGQQEKLVSEIENMERALEEPICKEWKVQKGNSLGEQVLEDRKVGIETSEKTTLLEELRVEGETSLGYPGSEEWRVEGGAYMIEPDSKEDRGKKRNMSLGELVLKQERVEEEVSLQGPSFESWLVEGDTTLWETSLYNKRVEDEMSLVKPVSEKGRVEEEASLGEPVQGSMTLETYIEGPVAEGSIEGEISMEESASEKGKLERETFLGNPVSQESRGVENLVMGEPELEEVGLEEERHLKQSCHPPKGEEEELCQSLSEPDLPPQELEQEVKTISVDQPYFKHQLVVEETHRSPNKSEYLFQGDILISTQVSLSASVLEGDKSLKKATYPVSLETDTFSLAETFCPPLVQEGQITLNSHKEREQDVILLQESECPSDLASEKYHMDKAKGHFSKDKRTLLEKMQSVYSLEKRPLGQTDGPMQHQREDLMVLPTLNPRHLDIRENTQVQEFITHSGEEKAVQKMAFTKIRVLPPIIGTRKVDESTQDLKKGDIFKREPRQQSVGKMKDTTSQSHEKEASDGQTVDTAVEKDKKKEDALEGLFNLEEVQTLDVSAQKSRIHLRRKVSIWRRQVPDLCPHTDHDTSTEPKERALPSLEPPSKLVEDQPMPLPVLQTHIKPAQWIAPGEGFPPPPMVLPKPQLIPGTVPIMMPGMVRPPHPQLIPGSSAKENLVTDGSMPAEAIAPKKKIPGHAGFGFAHPQMMQELQFRLRKPKPQ
ncbi:uncharacterized protein LOC144768557 [Lissotriton helveticus]